MRLHRLWVENFAVIREVDIAFGPGLNVLYGPNDLGKSTLADAIRLVLLLPHTSTSCEPYMPWSGGKDPTVDLTFETEEQRFWRVRKEFGKGGSSVLQESRNGRDFDEIERARGVDAKLREILRWGIPEPGAGAGKGLPTSFLSTALLSTQGAVTDVLRGSLQNDLAGTGKEWVAAALQAAAQDPLFARLLREVQERRDEAYTDKGAKKTARGSVFKAAADRLREAREEKEHLQRTVEESRGVERRLQELFGERDHQHQQLATAADRLAAIEQLANQAADRAAAAERVRLAQDAVLRIQRMDRDVADAEERLRLLAVGKELAGAALRDAEAAATAAGERLKAAEGSQSTAKDGHLADTVARQSLELRQVAAEQAAQVARQRVASAASTQALVDAAERAKEEHRQQELETVRAREEWVKATQAEQAANDALRGYDLLERGLEARTAEQQVASAQANLERESALQAELRGVSAERAAATERRAAVLVPPAESLAAMRTLETELASARGALEVGLVMTVIPTAIVNLRIRKDGAAADAGVISQPVEIEASAEVEVDVGDLATVLVRGGRRGAQERVRALGSRWEGEVLPHLAAAGVADLEALQVKVAEAKELDSRIQSLDGDLESLRRQIAGLADVAEVLREASARVTACHLELKDVALDTLAADLDSLGPDHGTAIRDRRQQASRDVETARKSAQEAATAQALAEDRVRGSRENLEAAVAAHDATLAEFPSGVAAGAAAAEEALKAALEEQDKVTAELASLKDKIDARRGGLEAALAEARQAAERAGHGIETAQEDLKKGIADHALQEGQLRELRRLREAEDLSTAEHGLRQATELHGALPVPERPINPDEVVTARAVLDRVKQDLENLDREIHITQGRLQQVGGAVVLERLRDASEAFDLAEQHERDIEADYEAWKLLLEQMKEADAAQASNLGQALAPAIAGRFQALTEQRYQSIQLTAYLGTDGVVAAGAVRPQERISVGTREQLSTLYRLCLGDHLQTTIVLDDQLVQSDRNRMDWFRSLLAEKARGFQIVVFTCRPGDYLARAAMVPEVGQLTSTPTTDSCAPSTSVGQFTDVSTLRAVLSFAPGHAFPCALLMRIGSSAWPRRPCPSRTRATPIAGCRKKHRRRARELGLHVMYGG